MECIQKVVCIESVVVFCPQCMCYITGTATRNYPDSKVRGANMGPIWGQ